MRRTLAIASLATSMIASLACSSGAVVPRVDKGGYVPSERIEPRSRAQIQQHMHALSDELFEMLLMSTDRAARDRYGRMLTPEERAPKVIEHLERIEARALRVGGRGTLTDNDAVNAWMDGFLEDVATARSFAARKPPNFVPANRLMRSCRSCHSDVR